MNKREEIIIFMICILNYGIKISFWNFKDLTNDGSIAKYYVEWSSNKYVNPHLWINILYSRGIMIKFLRGRD